MLSAPSLAALYFSKMSLNGTISGKKKVTEHKMCVSFALKILFEIFLILRINQRGIVKNVKTLSCKVSVILFILMKL